MKKTGILICIIFSIFFSPFCSKQPETLRGVVTFVHGNLKINSQDAVVGSSVQQNDVLTTADNSLAVIQVSQTAVITLRPDTELKFDNLVVNKDESQVVSSYLSKGNTFHKVIRKGTDYKVKTPTVVASVRGTSFEVKTDEAKSRVSLLNGIVHVEKQGKDAKKTELNPGQFVEVTSDTAGEPAALDKTETDRLAQLDTIAAVPEVEKIKTQKEQGAEAPKIDVIQEPVKELILKEESGDKGESKTPEGKKDKFVPDAKAVKALIKKQGRTIEDIKVVFQRIDEISLFSGRIIKGAIVERGNTYSIITTAGVIKVPEKEIQTVKVVK